MLLTFGRMLTSCLFLTQGVNPHLQQLMCCHRGHLRVPDARELGEYLLRLNNIEGRIEELRIGQRGVEGRERDRE